MHRALLSSSRLLVSNPSPISAKQPFPRSSSLQPRSVALDTATTTEDVDMASIAPSRIITAAEGSSCLANVDTLILDCDGVLWRGSELLPRTKEALELFRAQGKRLLFVTNNASKSRRQYVSKFASLGLEVKAEEIVAASYAAAAYLKSIDFKRKVLLISCSGVDDELDQHGIPYVKIEGPQDMPLDEMKSFTLDPEVGAIVMGWDSGFNYRKIVVATAYLRERSDVLFVGTNPDNADSLGGGRFMPGTGCLIQAVESASLRKATIVGKGGDFLFPYLLKKYSLDPQRTMVVGDRLDTDICLGKQTNALTALPLTGVSQIADVQRAAEKERPDLIIKAFPILAGLDV